MSLLCAGPERDSTEPVLAASRVVTVGVDSEHGIEWGIAEEVAVEVGFNGMAWVVMMATPQNVTDLAIGLAFSEGVIASSSDVDRVSVRRYPEGISADIIVSPDKIDRASIRRRALSGMTGCGLCGLETLADMARRPRRAVTERGTERTRVSREAIEVSFANLAKHQRLNIITRTVHAAAWCDGVGNVTMIREDVGRHNALDKLIGALLRDNASQERGISDGGFIVMSSRCSFELVSKAASIGASVLATISAPTGLAIDLAKEVNLELASRDTSGKVVFFDLNAAHICAGRK